MFGKTSTIRRRIFSLYGLLIGSLLMLQGIVSVASTGDVDPSIEQLKSRIADHSAQVFALEQELLYPADSRLSVFLTLASRDALDLDAIELFVDDKPVVSHLYSPREQDALEEGGVQQLFKGNLANGEHALKVVITARAGDDRFVRRETVHRFQKRPGTLRMQVSLDAKAPDFEPRVAFAEWK
ncbi:MAG: AraC family transcriptional regulator [Pseudomonadota bacterium]|nr:AraC family transcriptional regulator [Pseudomonadota bacterium]